ncbi:trypsin-like peptidase domain-containing protein [Nocardiopsis sp. LOL_012]|uniref:S1C family serine protease n=1 Tax=Nocardiopsis sp. LOL_012 TaxID=3345409 RepID=UPI003A842903
MNPNEPSAGQADGDGAPDERPAQTPDQREAAAGAQGHSPRFEDTGADPETPREQPAGTGTTGEAPSGEPFAGAADQAESGPRFAPTGRGPEPRGWAADPEGPGQAPYTYPPPGAAHAPGWSQGHTGQYGQPGQQYGSHQSGPGGPYPPHGAPGQYPQGGETGAFAAGGHPGFGGGQPPYGPPAPPAPRGGSSGRGRVVAIAAITALATSLVVGPIAAAGTAYLLPGGGSISSLTSEQGTTPTEGEVGAVAEAVLPSVVSIQTVNGSGSGVIISSDGEILTNAHVVEAATQSGGPLQVQFNDGTTATARVLGSDTVSDIAVIQAEGRTGLQAATLGDSDQVGVGGDVVAIGSPLGLSGTVTSGVVSALDRPVNTGVIESAAGQTSTVINAIQTDAAINPGNSGGPLVNLNGEVIGINTAIAGLSEESGSVGLGFAIPINHVRPIAEQLIEEGSATYSAIEATITGSSTGGATVVEVSEGGAADRAGIEAGDVVVGVDGEVVTSPDQLIALIRSHRPGDEVTFEVLKQGSGEEQEVMVTLGEQTSSSVRSGEDGN